MGDLLSLRKGRGLSLTQVALNVGFRSKGYLSKIENGAPANLRLALKIEAFFEGEVSAGDLVSSEDAALLASHCRLQAARATGAPA